MSFFNDPLSDLALPALECVKKSDSLATAVKFLSAKNLGMVGVENEEGSLCGVLSERDLLLRCDPNDFAQWHEISVEQVMTKKIFSLELHHSLADAISMMARLGFRHLPFHDSQGQWQIISARDVLGLIIENYQSLCSHFGTLTHWETEVGHIHEEDYVFHGQKDALETGSFLFASMKEIGGSDMLKIDQALPIGELWGALRAAHLNIATISQWSTKPIGIVTERDFVQKVFCASSEILQRPVREIMTADPHAMLLKHHLVYALNNMSTYRYRSILIVDEDRLPLKMIELVDFLRFFRRVMQDCGLPID